MDPATIICQGVRLLSTYFWTTGKQLICRTNVHKRKTYLFEESKKLEQMILVPVEAEKNLNVVAEETEYTTN